MATTTISKAVSTLIAWIILIPLSITAAAVPQWKGTIAKEGDVTVVRNPKEPIYKDPLLTLKEDWAIGGEKAQGEYAISKPWSLAVDKAGNVFVLEIVIIKVFDQNGIYVRTIGRSGQGPGDIGAAFDMSIAPGADELAVSDRSNSRFAFFDLEGRFRRNIPARGIVMNSKVDSQGNIYFFSMDSGPDGRRDVLKKMSPDLNKVLAEVISHPQERSPNPFKARDIFILDGQDHLIYGDAKTYEIKVFTPEGKLIRKIIRDHEPLKVTQKDIEEYRNRPTPPGINFTDDYSSRHAAYRSFFADDLGHLFVQTWERTVDNRQDIHDVFDAEGRFLGRVALPRHADLINPRVRILKEGKFYAIEPDAEGFEIVKRYSVAWNVK